MFRNGDSHAGIFVSHIDPVGMVGNYDHLRYSPGFYQPNNVDKGTNIYVRKIHA